MDLKIKRIDKSLPLPEYQTNGSVAFDFYAREETTIGPKEIKLIPLNIILETKDDFFLLVMPRSSLAMKKGLMCINSGGVIDHDYQGPNDEIKFLAYNFTDKPVTVVRGERIAQGLLIKFVKAEFNEVENISDNSRGGFGSTGI